MNAKPNKVEIKLPKLKLGLAAAIVISVLLFAYIIYFVLPVWNIRFVGWPFAAAVILAPLAALSRLRKLLFGIYVLLGLFVFLMLFSAAPLFRAKGYRAMIGEVQRTEFSELISPIKLDQVPIVDQRFAMALAEKKLGDDYALGSRVTLGSPTMQMVSGRLFWVIPLLHSGFFKWLANMSDGTPGYIMVAAANPQDISFVRELAGKPIHIRYQRNSYFGQDLYRHLYYHGFAGMGLAGDTFELDDNGEPHWTITTYTHKVGARAPEATGLATVHAGTGEIKYYPLIRTKDGFSDKNIPAWVDRVQPSYFVIPQLSWWGKYVHGFWNTKFGKRDMLMVTDGFNVIYGTDNRSYFYTGMSSVGSDEGTVGFILTDTRDKSTHFYRMSGATEYAAMKSAEGRLQNFKYIATFPILVNMNGTATYFMTLKDSAGLVKQFAFVSVKDFSIVGVGESIKAARDNFQMMMASSRVGVLPGAGPANVKFTATIDRIGSDIKEARAYYYLSLAEKPGLVYIATTDLSSFLPIAKSGDSVSVEHLETNEKEINLTGLKINSLEE
jgi:hypothetical protein